MPSSKVAPQTIKMDGICYHKGWIFGLLGKKNRKCYSLAACIPEGVELHNVPVEITIRVLPPEEARERGIQ